MRFRGQGCEYAFVIVSPFSSGGPFCGGPCRASPAPGDQTPKAAHCTLIPEPRTQHGILVSKHERVDSRILSKDQATLPKRGFLKVLPRLQLDDGQEEIMYMLSEIWLQGCGATYKELLKGFCPKPQILVQTPTCRRIAV